MPEIYERWMDSAFAFMQAHDLHTVKSGYVGTLIPRGEYHHGQYMVRHYRKVIETAAKYHVAINAHEPIKGTGIRRTYPNAISREGLRGQEFNAWASDGGNPPEHLTIVPFTRMLAGPIDFTPGVFDILLESADHSDGGRKARGNRIHTTLAHQLAAYVVIYSPVQMLPDLPANYRDHPAFQFIRDVGVDWERTVVLDGEPGEFVVIAREERGTGRWFLGALTDENSRSVEVSLDFLGGGNWSETAYFDGVDADWKTNPLPVEIRSRAVSAADVLKLDLAPGGGAAVAFFPAE